MRPLARLLLTKQIRKAAVRNFHMRKAAAAIKRATRSAVRQGVQARIARAHFRAAIRR
jgi:hypothetical protein